MMHGTYVNTILHFTTQAVKNARKVGGLPITTYTLQNNVFVKPFDKYIILSLF